MNKHVATKKYVKPATSMESAIFVSNVTFVLIGCCEKTNKWETSFQAMLGYKSFRV